jgi:retron-type reverse transcriptase
MGILSWIFGNKSKKYDCRKVEKYLGPWQPYTGSSNFRGTGLPKTFTVPVALKKNREDAEQRTFSDILFPFWLRIDPALAGYVMKKIMSGDMYSRKEILRPEKEPRIISVPAPILKFIQRRILERVLEQIEIHPASHGFIKGRSIFSAAEKHVGKRVVVSMDIRDFFGSISFRRVTGMFKAYGISKKQALLLAGLCCLDKKLPQGAPTSPAISNIVCKRLDSRLSGLCKRNGFTYARYADDMIFSGDSKILKFLKIFREIINKEGFTVAEEKTVVRRSGSRQRILGLNVNTKVSVPRRARRLVRAMVHRQSQLKEPDDNMIPFLLGHAAFMSKAHPEQAAKFKNILKNL